jgi:hypothetical protein
MELVRPYGPRVIQVKLHDGVDLRWQADIRPVAILFVLLKLRRFPQGSEEEERTAVALQNAFIILADVCQWLSGTPLGCPVAPPQLTAPIAWIRIASHLPPVAECD